MTMPASWYGRPQTGQVPTCSMIWNAMCRAGCFTTIRSAKIPLDDDEVVGVVISADDADVDDADDDSGDET